MALPAPCQICEHISHTLNPWQACTAATRPVPHHAKHVYLSHRSSPPGRHVPQQQASSHTMPQRCTLPDSPGPSQACTAVTSPTPHHAQKVYRSHTSPAPGRHVLQQQAPSHTTPKRCTSPGKLLCATASSPSPHQFVSTVPVVPPLS